MARKENGKSRRTGIRQIGTLFLTAVMILVLVCPVLADAGPHKITLEQTDHGTISCDTTQAGKDEVIKVKAVPDDGYRLAFLTFDDETALPFRKTISDGENEYSASMPEHDSIIKAQFVPQDQFGIRVVRNIPEGGTVSLSRKEGKSGDSVTLNVQTKEGYSLENVQYSSGSVIYGMGGKAPGLYEFQIHDDDVQIQVVFRKNVKNYTDVPKNSWYSNAVIYLTNRGILGGVSETEFAPNGKVTRAQLCQTIYAMQEKPRVLWKYGFSDVPDGKWYTDAVNWCAQKRYVTGYPDRTFRPDQVITREQMALILYQFNKDVKYKLNNVDENTVLQFKDRDQISDYARTAMLWAVEQGLFAGTGDGKLEPQGEVTRAQLAVILSQFLPVPMAD